MHQVNLTQNSPLAKNVLQLAHVKKGGGTRVRVRNLQILYPHRRMAKAKKTVVVYRQCVSCMLFCRYLVSSYEKIGCGYIGGMKKL